MILAHEAPVGRKPLLVMLAVIGLAALTASSVGEEGERQPNAAYLAVWEKANADAELAWVSDQVSKIRHPIDGSSRDTMRALREKLGLRSEDVRSWGASWRRSDKSTWDAVEARGWQAYLANLQVAVLDKVPFLLDEREDASERAAAAKFLGDKAPHPCFLPLLKALATNPGEAPAARRTALTTIAYIPHGDVVAFYIEHLYDPARAEGDPYVNEALTNIARGHLKRLVGGQMDEATRQKFVKAPPREAQELWRAWWEAHKETWKYLPRIELFLRWH